MTLVLADSSIPGGMPSAMHVPKAVSISRETPTAESLALDSLIIETYRHWREGRISESERDRRLAEPLRRRVDI
jgi:hypothetical protein